MKKYLYTFLMLTLAFNFSNAADSDSKAAEDNTMTWVGEIKDTPRTHTTDHRHALEFTRDSDGESFDIVDSPDLKKLHHDSGKNFRIEAQVELTPKFLFFGGNLIVKSFKVIEETSPSIPHVIPTPRESTRNLGERSLRVRGMTL